MGLMFRRRRPLARLATGAATAGVVAPMGHLGKRNVEHEAYNEQAAAACLATRDQQYVPPAHQPAPEMPPPAPTRALPPPLAPAANADLDHLVELRRRGDLSDDEFTAAKARLLGL